MSVPPAIELEALLAEERWIRRLARRLVSDPNEVDDLVQETWVAALSAGKGRAAERPWAGAVVRNLWRDLLRGRSRRERRERGAARPEATGSTDELVAELELRQRVGRSLLELDEPYRTALYLRFFKDRSLRSIARSEGVSVTTAHERVQRGLARLRARLDREHGGRREAWGLGLLALGRSSGTLAEVIGGIVMGTGIKVAASVLVAGGVLAWIWHERGPEARVGTAEAPPPSAALPIEAAPASAALAEARREPVEKTGEIGQSPSADDTGEPGALTLHGLVVDNRGNPVGGVEVAMLAGSRDGAVWVQRSAFSGPDGRFSFEIEEDERWSNMRCRDPGYATLVRGQRLRGEEHLVIVAPRAAFAGEVVDETGAPVEGAELVFRPEPGLFRELGIQHPKIEILDSWRATSDGAGRFSLPDVGAGPHVSLEVKALGFQEKTVELPPHGDPTLQVVLERESRAIEITGSVLDPEGRPFEGARVSAGREVVTSAANGGFRVVSHALTGRHVKGQDGAWRPEENETVRLIALAPGLLPAVEEFAGRDPPVPVVLHLGAAPLSISGRVVAPDGRGLPGVVVWPRALTPFAQEWGGDGSGYEKTVEEELCRAGGWLGTVTGADGAFELDCLMERGYDLQLFEARSATCGAFRDVPAGSTDLELVLEPEPGTTRVAGRVVSAGGVPRSGVTIKPRRAADLARGATPPQLAGGEFWVETDEEGRFEFPALATLDTVLDIEGMPWQSVTLAECADLEHIEIVRPLLCELQVVLRDPALADVLGVFDARGAELSVIERIRFEANRASFTDGPRAEIQDGSSSVIQVPETARTLVLFKKDVEVLRIPIQVHPDRPTTIRP